MNLLILGGTRFLGRHLTQAALDLGHHPTLFHRGMTGADLFPNVPRILGDRDGGLDALGDGRWDAVIDTCGYVPRVVRASAEILAPRAGQYAFVSTISVAAGLRFRALRETVRDVVAWLGEREAGPPATGMKREREGELVAGMGG